MNLKPLKVAQFICAKSKQFYDAFAALFDERSDLIWDKLIEIVGGRDKPFWFAQVVQFALEISCDYKRRVIMKVQTSLLLLVWLVWSRPFKDCECRRSCAADLLSPGLSETCGDDTTHKIVFLFKKELEEARGHGTLDVDLHELLMDLCWLWKLDTQAIERGERHAQAQHWHLPVHSVTAHELPDHYQEGSDERGHVESTSSARARQRVRLPLQRCPTGG